MAESTQSQQQSFAAHVQALYDSMPPEEQTMLERVFALAQSASNEQADVQGFNITRDQVATFIVRAFFLAVPPTAEPPDNAPRTGSGFP